VRQYPVDPSVMDEHEDRRVVPVRDERVMSAIEALPGRLREVVAMKLEQISNREIAAMVGVSQRTVIRRWIEGLERLRGAL
jgi:DNA-directed RNA polymerase specialized sigma24 family protein